MKRFLTILFAFCFVGALSAQSNLSYVMTGLKHDRAQWILIQHPYAQTYSSRNDSVLASTARECHDIRLTLYSCDNMGFFDLTHELRRTLKMYKRLEEMAMPNSTAIVAAENEKMRMQYLLETLRRMPPELATMEEVSDSIAALESDSLLHVLVINSEDDFYVLSEEEQALRDSCVILAREHIHHQEEVVRFLQDYAESYGELRDEFRSTYDYASERYEKLIHDVYYDAHQVTLLGVLHAPLQFLLTTIVECIYKYNHADSRYTLSEFMVVLGQMFGMLFLAITLTLLVKRVTYRWRKQLIRLHRNTSIVTNAVYMALLLVCLLLDVQVFHLPLISMNMVAFLVYFVYVLMLQCSLLVRCAGERATAGVRLYTPGILFGFFLIFMHMYFVPDSLLCMMMFPLTIGCWIWQSVVVLRYWNRCHVLDSSLGAITSIIFFVTAILTCCGYSMRSIHIIFWWLSQEAAIVIIAVLYYLARHYGDQHIHSRVIDYQTKRTGFAIDADSAIQITWFHDLYRMVGLPLLAIGSVPTCLYMSLIFFNSQDQFLNEYRATFFSLGSADQLICDLSIEKLMWVLALYFWFNFLRYVSVCVYRQISTHLAWKRSGRREIHTNQLNLTLGINLINLIVWGLYVVVCSIILKIPMTALTVIIGAFTGGIGFAMKDIVNNIIYGTQLMAGRLRVGDYIICDNYRGEVSSISYQTTQIITEDGALVSFTNADLFSKNFQNLTRHNPYEVNRVVVNVPYDSDIELVEKLIREAIQPLNQKDKFGRMLLSEQEGIRIEMRDLGESGISMAVRFGVIAERRTWFLPVARKAIYENLISHGISIPFRQVEIRMK